MTNRTNAEISAGKFLLDNSQQGAADIVDTATDNTLRTVATDKTFHLGIIMITNKTGSQDEIDIWDGASLGQSEALINLLVPTGETITVDMSVLGSPKFTTSIVAQSSNASPGNGVKIRVFGSEF